MSGLPRHTAETSIFARPLWSLTLLCCRFPAAVLCLSLLTAAASVYYSAGHLGLKMSRLDLINPHSSFNQLWLDYIDEFGDSNEVIIVAEGKDNAEVIPVLKTLAEKIEQFPRHYQGVLRGIDLSAIHRKGLHYVPLNDLKKIEKFAAGAAQMLNGRSNRGQIPAAPPDIDDVSNLLTTLAQSHTEGDINYFVFPVKNSRQPPANSVIGFVLLRLINIDKTQFSQGTEAIDQLRRIVTDVQRERQKDCPDLKIGLTGMPILESDEMSLSNDAMMKATVLALIGVGAVFMAGFGSLRHPLLALAALMIAFAWTMGYISLAVGHLNILSIAFGAMLIGLGTDFSVHYLARYLDLRRNAAHSPVEALCQTAELVGPGILTGAFTTSAAFYAASFAEFTGVAELGTIAGGGILFCAVTTFTVFPALIVLITPGSRKDAAAVPFSAKAPSGQLIDICPALQPAFVFPKMTLFLFAVCFVALLPGIPKVWYDHNLLHLQPVGLESVELEQRLLSLDVDKGGKNVWFALSIADTKEELLERKKQFSEKYPDLTVEEIVSFFPEAEPERIAVIKNIAEMLQGIPAAGPIAGAGNVQTPAALLPRLQTLKAMAVIDPPSEKDLPLPLVERFIGKRGKHLMRIYTKANIWDMDEMEKFVRAVRDIDPQATGSPLQTYESSKQMRQGFISAAFYAFGAVVLFIFVDFRSITATAASLLPMVLGFAMMFGVLGWLDLALNPANMIVLPLILGIGIDHGVHLIHDFRSRREQRYKISSSTAAAILITSLTTIIGFGSMMIASHRGLQSLGRVLVIGVTCCLITSILVLPVILTLWTGRDKDEPISRKLPEEGQHRETAKRLKRREPA
ncbi:MAG: MMPL family transporter [Planctomycetaceae bacterium]|jgi:predicted RND superfamily exporter protein|nr:MMPL family transporter [Planctomycetaceae bacterium]